MNLQCNFFPRVSFGKYFQYVFIDLIREVPYSRWNNKPLYILILQQRTAESNANMRAGFVHHLHIDYFKFCFRQSGKIDGKAFAFLRTDSVTVHFEFVTFGFVCTL